MTVYLFIDASVECHKRQTFCRQSKDRNDIRDIDLIIPVSKERIKSISKCVVLPTGCCRTDLPIHIEIYLRSNYVSMITNKNFACWGNQAINAHLSKLIN